jgi:hypothetical protein
MVSSNLCGSGLKGSPTCSQFFSNNQPLKLNLSYLSPSWTFDLVQGVNNLTIKSNITYGTGSMLLLSLLDANVAIRMTTVSSNNDYIYANNTVKQISSTKYALRVKALTTRYYYVTQGSFQSKQFSNVSGIRTLVVNYYDRFNNQYINATATYVIPVAAGMGKNYLFLRFLSINSYFKS